MLQVFKLIQKTCSMLPQKCCAKIIRQCHVIGICCGKTRRWKLFCVSFASRKLNKGLSKVWGLSNSVVRRAKRLVFCGKCEQNFKNETTCLVFQNSLLLLTRELSFTQTLCLNERTWYDAMILWSTFGLSRHWRSVNPYYHTWSVVAVSFHWKTLAVTHWTDLLLSSGPSRALIFYHFISRRNCWVSNQKRKAPNTIIICCLNIDLD